MRENIGLFRGKRKDNHEWIEGYLYRLIEKQNPFIMAKDRYGKSYEVIPETVGEYTGLTDKNGKKIFEGDIVHAVYKNNYVGIPDTVFGNGVIKYAGTYYSGARYEIDIIGEAGSRIFSAGIDGGVTVIGNIHDNPELLRSEQE